MCARWGLTRLPSPKKKIKSSAGKLNSSLLLIHKTALERSVVLVPLEAALERNCAIEDRLESPQCRGF